MVQVYCASPFLFFFGITCTNNLYTINFVLIQQATEVHLSPTVWLSSHLLSSPSIYFKLPNCPRRTLARPWPSSRLSFPLSPAQRLATLSHSPSQCPPVSCSTLPRSPESPPSSSFSYHLLSCPFSVIGRSKKTHKWCWYHPAGCHLRTFKHLHKVPNCYSKEFRSQSGWPKRTTVKDKGGQSISQQNLKGNIDKEARTRV